MYKAKNLLALVAVLALVVVSLASVSALSATVDIQNVKINEYIVGSNPDYAVFPGEILSVKVKFEALSDESDVRVKAWISGDSDVASKTEEFHIFAGHVYSRELSVDVPSTIDAEGEDLRLIVEVGKDGYEVRKITNLHAQRNSYEIDVLNVNMDVKVAAGDNLALDIVLKNRGLDFSEDTFVRARIPELGVSETAYFGDLSTFDEKGIDNGDDDAAEGKVYLHIPVNAEPGIYDVVIDAYNGDTETTLSRKVVVVSGAREDTLIASAVKSRTLAVGEEGEFSLTLVNTGDNVRVYELAVDSSDEELDLSLNEPFVIVQAGSSETVVVNAAANEAGKYSFTVKAYSGNELAKEESFSLKASGSRSIGSGNDAAVLLTVVLAIIFVVLLVVLIVLLTRKPQKTEEFGESYY